jgi:transposase
VEKQYVGIDLHRRRSLIVRMSAAGEVLEQVRIANDPVTLALEIEKAGPDPEVVVEATYGWYWAADVLELAGASVHLAHPLGVKAFSHERVKRDETDACRLIDLLRLNRLPEAWIAPHEVRELRELVRYRAKLVALRSGLKAQVHSVVAKAGVAVPMTDLFGRAGLQLLGRLELPHAYSLRLTSLLGLIDAFDRQVDLVSRELRAALSEQPGYWAIQAIAGVGPTFAALFVAEIGDVSRFASPNKLCSWAGLTPRHRQSNIVVRRGPITKQGCKLVRWAAVEAAQKLQPTSKLERDFRRIAERRGRKIGRVAAARKLLTLVYYGLRDGEVRCLAQPHASQAAA